LVWYHFTHFGVLWPKWGTYICFLLLLMGLTETKNRMNCHQKTGTLFVRQKGIVIQSMVNNSGRSKRGKTQPAISPVSPTHLNKKIN